MESLKSELSLVLGETVGRLETISEQSPTRLYALYERHDKPMPLMLSLAAAGYMKCC